MIEIKSTKNKRTGEYEWCNCCRNRINTKRIIFSQNSTSGTAIVLCEKCRKDLIKAIIESEEQA